MRAEAIWSLMQLPHLPYSGGAAEQPIRVFRMFDVLKRGGVFERSKDGEQRREKEPQTEEQELLGNMMV